jgi:D-xylose transport system substrate-binding protein
MNLKKTFVLTFVLVILTGGMVMAKGNAQSGKKTVIGVSLPTQREEIWVKGREAMEAEAAKLGVEIRIVLADADINVQTSQVENLLSQGISALILAPVNSDAVSTLVEKAHAENVPVICFARLANNADVDYYVTCDPIQVGEYQGQYLLDHIPNGANVIVMSGAPTDNLALAFKKGAMNKLTPAAQSGKIKIVTELAVENWLPDNAMKIVENSLTQNRNNIQGILAPNDGTAGGAIQALAAQGLVGQVVITGQDTEAAALERILAGQQSMTIYKDIALQAVASVQAAKKLAEGAQASSLEETLKTNNGRKDVPTLSVPPTIITRENAAEYQKRLGL